MTPEAHLIEAEKHLDSAALLMSQKMTELAKVHLQAAQTHAAIAHAVEQGVPHGAAGPAVD